MNAPKTDPVLFTGYNLCISMVAVLSFEGAQRYNSLVRYGL
jgi:hypothetical protein